MSTSVRLYGIAAAGIGIGLFAASAILIPRAFAGRVLPGVFIGQERLGALAWDDVEPLLDRYEASLQEQRVVLTVRSEPAEHTLGEMGVKLDRMATQRDAMMWDTEALYYPRRVATHVQFDPIVLGDVVQQSFAAVIAAPQNATLALASNGSYVLQPGHGGEGVDTTTLEQDIKIRAARTAWNDPIELTIIQVPPQVHDGEVADAQRFANELVRSGLTLVSGDDEWTMRPSTIRRLIDFAPMIDPQDPQNYVLGVTLDAEGVRTYLASTIQPLINQPAVNARFERTSDRVTQFALPQDGRDLNVTETVENILAAALHRQPRVAMAVSVTAPTVRDTADIEALGITDLLAVGDSDFVGSPPNRVHNIGVGRSRYHGLLIAPGEQFSFNEFLGPVTGAAGYKPELVIKNNVTTPEFGGGLCQVSTTAFRAALNAGLVIDERRNHSYAVRYYGKAGFDATIYPGHTDLKFTNNTPGYILIQTRLEGTKLAFEFWGTDDGREVLVEGPFTYGHQPDGAVKATLRQTVTREGETVIEDTFYSNYKSPKLFPKIVAADDPTRVD